MTESKGNSASDFVKAQGFVALKTFNEKDGQSRIITSYKAPITTIEGGLCIKTTISYFDTSNVVEKLKEELSTWPSGADI